MVYTEESRQQVTIRVHLGYFYAIVVTILAFQIFSLKSKSVKLNYTGPKITVLHSKLISQSEWYRGITLVQKRPQN